MLVSAFHAPLVVALPDSAPHPDTTGTEPRPIEATDGPGRGGQEHGAHDSDLADGRRDEDPNRPDGRGTNRTFSPQLLAQEQEQAESELRAEETGQTNGGERSALSQLSLASEATEAYGRSAGLLSGEDGTARLAAGHDRVA